MFHNLLSRRVLFRREFLAMGTTVVVTLVVDRRGAAAADAAIAAVKRDLIQFGRDAWAWGEGSLAVFNRRLQAGEAAAITPSLLPLFRKAWEVHRASGGLFDPRIAPLVRLWGFDDPARLRSVPPKADDIRVLLEALRAAPAYDGGDRYGPAPLLAWDFGALGKGYIVDHALNQLAAAGFQDATIDAGGNVGVRGLRSGRPWRIGIREPMGALEQEVVLATVEPDHESVVTHGDDQRYFEHEGQRYAHLLDPRSGWPVQGLRSLTVIHPDGCLADAAGAALFVAGASAWPALARQLGITKVLAITAEGGIQVSRELSAALSWTKPASFDVVD